jgi:enoyl-CoA hydratase
VIARLAAGPAVAFAKTKDAICAATLTELEPALAREFNGQSGLLRANDLNEGTKAFQEKRAPVFTDS